MKLINYKMFQSSRIILIMTLLVPLINAKPNIEKLFLKYEIVNDTISVAPKEWLKVNIFHIINLYKILNLKYFIR